MKTTAFTLGAAGLAASGIALYEPNEVKVEQVELRLPRLPRTLDGFRLAQISDIHFGQFIHDKHLRKVVSLINAEAPDLAVATGDFVTVPLFGPRRKAADLAWPCAEILKGIQAKHGRFAILGNHDRKTSASAVTEALQTHGTPVLRNRAIPIQSNSGRFWLAGLDDVLTGHPDLGLATQKIPKGECVVVAVHEPDYADEVSKQTVDLQISGHSHGGQVRFPGLGAMYLPRLGRKYVMGSYLVRQTHVYTNRGVGVILLPVRFLCPPEITLFTLRTVEGVSS